jgi:beta-N-acetylhexosaminidase
VAGFILSASACAQEGRLSDVETEQGPTRPVFLKTDSTSSALDSLLDAMSIDQQLGQLFMVPLYSRELNEASFAEVLKLIQEHGVGGVICMQGETEIQKQHLARLDSAARKASGWPLLTSMDAEWGAAMRLSDGIGFPRAMAIAATGDVRWAFRVGQAVGRHLKSTGIDVNFAPVADVNNNPLNPVIGTRSFGSDPVSVGAMSAAYSRGLQAGGVLGVGKHFPGHGDTDIDSHLGLPLITGDSARLHSVELPPFKDLIYSGVSGMMTAHLVVPALDSTSGLPASLSPQIIDTLLRKNLGFEGLIFTDALTMAGAADAVPPGELEVLALLAGNDVLLFPSDVAVAMDSLRSALAHGRLDSAKVRAACGRVLQAKQWAAKPREEPQVNAQAIDALQDSLRAAMFTVLSPPAGAHATEFPLPPYASVGVLNLNRDGRAFCDRLQQAHACDCIAYKTLPKKKNWPELISALSGYDYVLVNVVDESNSPKRRFGVPQGFSEFIGELENVTPVGISLFTSPYATAFVDTGLSAPVLIGYHQDDRTLAAAAASWCAEGDALGRLPVAAGPWAWGAGEPARASRLTNARRDSLWVWDMAQHRLDSLMQAALELNAFPGARVLVAHKGEIVINASYGHLDQDKAHPVTNQSVYDLASITKVAATTLLTAQALEMGLLDLDSPIGERFETAKLTPELNPELAERTLRQILSHTAGLPSWIPFYLDVVAAHDTTGLELLPVNKAGECDSICAIQIAPNRCMACRWTDSLQAEVHAILPGPTGSYQYSDLGYYLLQEILEHRFERPLDSLAHSLIFEPLQLQNIGYHPLRWAALHHIAPTELDTTFRGEMVHGRVHDPGASMLGGVAGHAGLFSDAHDLALLMECIRTGAFNNVQIVRPETLDEFTRRALPDRDVRRGLGWDKPGLEPDTGASCDEASAHSFGHSGFTGTLAWTDPKHELTFIFLSNRIHPNAENRTLITEDIRTRAMQMMYHAIGVTSRFEPDVQ